MLPDPKKVAKFLNRTIFRSAEERKREQELERDVQVRITKGRIRGYLESQNKMVTQLTTLAKRALALGDETRFRQVGRQLLWTQKDILRWERYLLSFEILEARRGQAKASVDLLASVKALGESLAEMAGPENMGEMQRELETGLARASNLEERMELMMDMVDHTLASDMKVDEGALEGLEANMTDEITRQEAEKFDPEIESGLRKIREELEKQSK